jgi:hypothetical protein
MSRQKPVLPGDPGNSALMPTMAMGGWVPLALTVCSRR